MKIKNMIKQCVISLFLINFSFLMFANESVCDTVIEKKEYGLKFYLSIIQNETEVLKINQIKSEKHDTIVIVFRCKKRNDDSSVQIKKGSNSFDYNEYGNVKWLKIHSVDNVQNDSYVFKKSDIGKIYDKIQERKKSKELIEKNEPSKETIIPELKEPNRETIILDKIIVDEETINLKSITNYSDYDVYYNIINENKEAVEGNLGKGEKKQISINIRRVFVKKNKTDKDPIFIWVVDDSKEEWNESHKNDGADEINNIKQEEKTKAKEKISTIILIQKIKNDLANDEYWSESSINTLEETLDKAKKYFKDTTDTTARNDYVKKEGLVELVKNEYDKYNDNNEKIYEKVEVLMSNYRNRYDIENEADCIKEIKKILEEKQGNRYTSIKELFDLLGVKRETESPIISIVVIVLIVIILIVCLTILSRKKKIKCEEPMSQVSSTNDATPAIVVRKTATSILKKQCLDDVINNKSYYKIESVDFCEDSAVRRIYIKNTCIKDIYNMYAEDLRNPNNPKEDGCMILGRWIYDEQANEYSVSLEESVHPGDDAVFQEYELNFGGKIKLRVAERLRKLRKESNLQYDLTCWVHSHPGLGVFFSNSDSSVQMQLKHPTHPNFLTAIVVDILTPEQEFGIFTFKRDSSINSRNDLKKMYSLEELYKWAFESERNSYKPEDHYNVLSKAKDLCEECQKIMLSNGAIIDISAIVMKQNSGLEGLIYGYKAKNTLKNEFVVCSVENNEQVTENELLGCLIIGTHCSIPSIKKAIVDYTNKIKFVMFYSLKEEIITIIPITNNELCMEEKYYSEEKLNDLKIWTRRKR